MNNSCIDPIIYNNYLNDCVNINWLDSNNNCQSIFADKHDTCGNDGNYFLVTDDCGSSHGNRIIW